MREIVESIKANERLPSVLYEIAKVNPARLQKVAETINDIEINQLGIWISGRIVTNGVESTIATGGLLFLYLQATDTDKRRELYDNLLEDVGVCRAQAYRSIAVWEHFGKLLIEEPKLIKYFVVEALKLLSRADTPQSARDEAIRRARKSERIRIAQANELIEKHQTKSTVVAIESKPKETVSKIPKRSNQKSIWSFVGRTVRLVLQPAKSKSTVNLEAIIQDLEAALESFRNQYAESKKSSSTKPQQVA